MGAVNTTYTFIPNDTITSTKMNNIIDETVITSDAISGTTLEVTGTGKLKIRSQGVTSNELAAGAVTYTKVQPISSMTALGNMTGSTDLISEIPVLNENDMASNSATALATQQSIKAYTETYVDSRYVLDTVKASTSGTSIDFTGIPSWVKKITVMFDGVSTNGTSAIIIRLGDGSLVTTGYVSSSSDAGGINTSTLGLLAARSLNASRIYTGAMTISKITGNTWVAHGVVSSDTNVYSNSGSLALSGVLDRLSVTTLSTDTFDAGQINISYE
jgi:hypothetical protein